MSTNLSKQKRSDLINKIKLIKSHIAKANQDKNTGNLLTYLSELEKEINGKKYGLVFEEHEEEIDQKLKTHTPVLSEEKDLFIDNGGQMNFLIEGDNLPALKLLEKTHKGKIDLIYIDPPYNTGANNWRYDNNYVDGNDNFKHSKWLSMMNSRLKIAKHLLNSNGSLVCAIDENEQSNLRLLLDEIFGENYEIDCITVIHNPGGIQGANFSYNHEYAFFIFPRKSYYINKETRSDDDLTPFRDWGKENSKRFGSPNCFFPIIINKGNIIGFGDVPSDDYHPKFSNEIDKENILVWPIDKKGIERRWRFSRQTVEDIASELIAKENNSIFSIFRNKKNYIRKTVWDDSKYNANIYGTQLLSKLISEKFPFPKSLYLVEECIRACEQNKDIIVLDFFAGSGTTGHAVMELNKKDGGSRKFILCTNNENNICKDVTYERIKNVIDKENFQASLKYFKINFISINEQLYYEYADKLLKHIRELVELENGINFEGNNKIKIILTDSELEAFSDNIAELKKCHKLYLGHDVLVSGVQEKLFKDNEIEINIIPDYYYKELES